MSPMNRSLRHRLLSAALTSGSMVSIACVVSSVHAADLSAVPSGAYELDDTHAYIDFSYNHLGLSNPSLSFDDFSVDLNLDNEDPTKSLLMVNIDPASIETGSAIFQDHITSEDWFNVAEYPEITFQSTEISAKDDGGYTVIGDLTVKDSTQAVTLDVTINGAMDHPMTGKPVIGLNGSGELLRSDFGLGNFAPNVSDEVQLSFSVELLKQQ